MHNPESVLEKEKQKRWDFEIQTDYLILARRPDLVIVSKKKKKKKKKRKRKKEKEKKRTGWIVEFAVLANHRV